jgi:hypothetical protein
MPMNVAYGNYRVVNNTGGGLKNPQSSISPTISSSKLTQVQKSYNGLNISSSSGANGGGG